MQPSDKEEKILIEREYSKHLEGIEKARMRERHFEMKDRGYSLSVGLLGDKTDIVSVFLGYIEALGIDRRSVYSHISDAVLGGNGSIAENLKSILRLGIGDKDSMAEEIIKTHR
ncbi:hypothetical protein [Encephalitozoon cuniculi GB-M1]|uniref:Uncharacterized protein n=2 Tax=Encephalitozoon cuniculi TaxID=6035 RepID=Q8STT3_ENCCU|nr:uncharacterized protein ECU09_0750 [Encephalitozoon cuniculi GB-M1]KMV65438.1 hypothetical protein M970_090760 [Encephalitozoon cuniculi EcunIII-L]UYI26760.1 hypothetical protein J0A71_03g05970 [Encephalitozoon cuniculi]CAD27048.2 hypothetical protein [Encephalitozoon cuniculi GB-M1]